MSTVQPGRDRHRVVAMGANRVFGVDGDALQTSYGLPWEPVNLGAGSVVQGLHRGRGPRGGAGHQLPDADPARRLRVADLPRRRRATRSRCATPSTGSPPFLSMTDALATVAEHRVRQAHGDHRRPAGGGHGGPPRHALARRAPGPDGSVDRRHRPRAEPGLVHPRCHADQSARARQRRAPPSPRAGCGARPRRSSRSPTRAARPCRSRSSPASRSSTRRWPTP